MRLLQSEFDQATTIATALSHFSVSVEQDVGTLLSEGCAVSVFGKKRSLESILQNGDRIEVCAPLIATPMDSRRRRAKREHKGGKM